MNNLDFFLNEHKIYIFHFSETTDLTILDLTEKCCFLKPNIPTETIFGKTLIKTIMSNTHICSYLHMQEDASSSSQPTIWFSAVAFHITGFTCCNTQLASQLAKSFAMSCCSHEGHRLLPASSAASSDQTWLPSAFAEVNLNACLRNHLWVQDTAMFDFRNCWGNLFSAWEIIRVFPAQDLIKPLDAALEELYGIFNDGHGSYSDTAPPVASQYQLGTHCCPFLTRFNTIVHRQHEWDSIWKYTLVSLVFPPVQYVNLQWHKSLWARHLKCFRDGCTEESKIISS